MELRVLYILGKCWTNETTSSSSVSTHIWRLCAVRAEQKISSITNADVWLPSFSEGVLKRWAGRKPYTTLEFAGLLEHLWDFLHIPVKWGGLCGSSCCLHIKGSGHPPSAAGFWGCLKGFKWMESTSKTPPFSFISRLAILYLLFISVRPQSKTDGWFSNTLMC